MPVNGMRSTVSWWLSLLAVSLMGHLALPLAIAQEREPGFNICEPPPVCFGSVEARRAWAEQHQCRFLEDVCSQTPPERDNQGARQDDSNVWGSLWTGIEGKLVYGYEFVKGLLTGLRAQITNLYSLVTDIDETIDGLVALGRAFYEDADGALRTLAALLGQEFIDNVIRASQCGAHDLGLVIGQNISPVTALKLAGRLSQYGENFSDAVHATRMDFGCASFAAGTPVMTPSGSASIEHIRIGQIVLSRDEVSQQDTQQQVSDVFRRSVSEYRLLETEQDSFRVTDEHPFWVQGKGWVQAKDLTDDDVIAGVRGDALVIRNIRVDEPLQVFNFSVTASPNYFIGAGGSWVHNARCKIEPIHERLPRGAKVGEFETSLVRLAPPERVARAKEMAAEVAAFRGWKKDSRLTALNGRDVYVGRDGYLYALDTMHARFEKAYQKSGKHIIEVRMDLSPVENKVDPSGKHDLKVK